VSFSADARWTSEKKKQILESWDLFLVPFRGGSWAQEKWSVPESLTNQLFLAGRAKSGLRQKFNI